MSLRQHLGVAVLLAALHVAGAAGVAAQPVGETFFDLDETFSIASMHRPYIHEAPAVVRLDARRFVVEDEGKAVEHVHRVVTILKPEGKEHARIELPYDKFRQIDRLEGRIRSPQGSVVRKLGRDDQRDMSAITSYSLYEDNRVRIAELFQSNYPYTVEFEYTIEHDGFISWPTWRAQERDLPVEHAAFEVDAPEHIPIRYQVENGEWAPEEGSAEGRHWMRWATARLSKGEREPYGPPWHEQALTVHTAPTAFEIEDKPGRMDDWVAFGRWYYELGQGRTQLPETTVERVHTLTAAADDTLAAVEALYRFMQDRTRYVSVQLGIGGWQPFPATYVEERGYGDCKALTIYMQALLEAADIPSFPVLIRAGQDEPPILPDFPSNQFNHVILAVPLDGDTLWLENTDQTVPFGHVGVSIEDRYGLLVTPDGGELVRTPRSTADDNVQQHRAQVYLEAEGNARATIRTAHAGNTQDYIRQALAKKTRREREKWLRDEIDIPNFSIEEADFSDVDRRRHTIEMTAEFSLPRYGSRTGQRLFIRPNLTQRGTHVPSELDEPRTTPVHIGRYPFTDVDSVTYALPDGYEVEAMPDPVRIETPFAHYEARVDVPSDGTLVYRRRVEVHQVTLPPDEYEALRTFMRQVAQADRQQVVLVRR